ncbi:Ubiquitin-like-specific protease ESD4 [Colletotrichum chlorophyti]|uniref:Ubiquitin-like-specific protease ESD4 n=1 Tax=Colletotrichum chlorophyti TaxID=708187 RepID=A0A1Q8RY20_9PEZI|nr:Ubiquitin-like-specific protease ESD4 [Colletotrichum chlorophyti]
MPTKLTIMTSPEITQKRISPIANPRPPRLHYPVGWFNSEEEYRARKVVDRDQIFPFSERPTNFGYSWQADRTTPNGLLLNPGLDDRDPLAAQVLPLQLKTFVGTFYDPKFGLDTEQGRLERDTVYQNSTDDRELLIQPNDPTLIEVTNSLGTRRIVVRASKLQTLTVRSAEQQEHTEGSPGFIGSRKRQAEDSEFDLIVANAEEQAQPVQVPPTNDQKQDQAAGLDSNEESRAQGRVAWLINIMTSVRGAVTKVSNSIAGYGEFARTVSSCRSKLILAAVHFRNHNAVERHSRDSQTGDVTTKRIKLGHEAETTKLNLVWIDESTRIFNWHEVAPFVQAMKDTIRWVKKGLEGKLPKSQSGSRAGSPAPRLDDDGRMRRLYQLSVHLGLFQQTVLILETIYSHTFFANMTETFKLPQSTMDYPINPQELINITNVKNFLDHFPEECAPVLTDSGVPRRILKGVSADLGALITQKPMPSLLQRAGLVGKVMKFFRPRDNFGTEMPDEMMPGTFPDVQTNSHSNIEGHVKTKAREPAEDAELSLESPNEEHLEDGDILTSPSLAQDADACTFVREHLADIALMGPKANPIPILKNDNRSIIALKRLQKARGIKKVQFSPSAKRGTPSPGRARGFLNKIFGSPPIIGSPLRHSAYGSSSSPRAASSPLRLIPARNNLSNAQIDGSPDSRSSDRSTQEMGGDPGTDPTSEESDGEDTTAKFQPRLVQHFNESLDELEAKGFFGSGGPREQPSCPPSPPTLSGLNISDDKEGELEDLSVAIQLLLDVDEHRRREEEERIAKKAEEERLRIAREAEEERLRMTGGLRVPQRPLITSLPDEWTQKVFASLRASENEALTATAEGTNLTRHDFLKVVPQTVWLNDEIVNGSLSWLDRYINEAAGAPEIRSPRRVCLALGSFFYKRLEDNGVLNTERALRRYGVSKANFLNLQTILMPICRANHWTLLVIRPQKRTVSHMDSFNPNGSPVHTNRALEWIKAFLGDDFKSEEWRTVRHEAPQQRNGYDCGVFTITNGMCVALGLNAIDTYTGEDLPLQRLRIAGMLLNKGFSGEFDLAGL